MTVATFRPDGSTPTFQVMAGQVMQCNVPHSQLSGVDAFRSIAKEPGRRFVVYRMPRAVAGRPLGGLGELVQMAEQPAQSTPNTPSYRVVAEGRFKDHPIRSVLSVLATSRQCLTLHFLDVGRPHARIVVKAGMVLSAVREGHSGIAAWLLLLRDPGSNYAVTREERSPAVAKPIGRIEALLMQRAPVAAPGSTRVVLEGRFADFPMDAVLKVMGLSRSCLELQTRRQGQEGPRLIVKAGQVLDIQLADTADPILLLRRLRQDPGDTFVVLRRPTPVGTVPMGSLVQMVTEASEDSDLEELATVVEVPSRPSRPPTGPPEPPVPSRPTLSPAPPESVPDPRFAQLLERTLEQGDYLAETLQQLQAAARRHQRLQVQIRALLILQGTAVVAWLGWLVVFR